MDTLQFQHVRKIQDISDDFSRMLPVFKHALEQLRIEVTRD